MDEKNQEKRKRGRPRKSAVSSDPKPADTDASSKRHKVPATVNSTPSSGVQTLRLKINLLNASDSGQLEQFPPRQSATPFEILSSNERALRAFEENIRFLASKVFKGVRKSLLTEIFQHLDFGSLLTSERVCRKWRQVLKEFLPAYRKKGIVVTFVDPTSDNGEFQGPFVRHKPAYASSGPHIRLLVIIGPEKPPIKQQSSLLSDKRDTSRRCLPKRAVKTVIVTKGFSRPEFGEPSRQLCLSLGQVLRYFWPSKETMKREPTVCIRDVTFHLNIIANGLWNIMQHAHSVVFRNVFMYGLYMYEVFGFLGPSTDSVLKISEADMILGGILAGGGSVEEVGNRKISSAKVDVDEFLELLEPALELAMYPVANSDRASLKQKVVSRWEADTVRTFEMLDRILRRHEPQLCDEDENVKIPHVTKLDFQKLKPITHRLMAWWEYTIKEVDESELEDQEDTQEQEQSS